VVIVQLELKDIKGGTLEQGYSCSLSEFPELAVIAEDGGPKFSEPLVFKLRFQRLGQLVAVDGTLDAVVTLKCGRCLGSFKRSLTESFAFTFAPQPESNEDQEDVELEVDDLNLIGYKDDILQLQNPLQEQLLMVVPISLVCEASCRGLCPSCGINLNRDTCNCVRKPFNNKFNVLASVDFKKS